MPRSPDEPLTTRPEIQRRPGAPEPAPPAPAPPTDPSAVSPPPPTVFPDDFIPLPDRWRLIENLGVNERLYDPYSQNTLKGDRPIFEDYFVVLSAISDTVIEPRSTPVPVGIQTGQPGSLDVFGDTEQLLFSQTLLTSISLIKGDTAYRPPDLELRFTPAFNFNRTEAEESRFPVRRLRARAETRNETFVGLQEAFLDYHIRNVSERFDFDSIRVGIQPFTTDFRGFLFQDNQLGVRLFGTRDNNLWQYNLAWFRRLDKDVNSGLNDLGEDPRNDDVFVANLYRQDFPILGLTSQATVVHNRSRDDAQVNSNGFPARPAEVGFTELREYDVTYLGLNFDGRIGPLNLTASGYYALGQDENSLLTGENADIRAFFLAAEPSIDFDWVRLRLSGSLRERRRRPLRRRRGGLRRDLREPPLRGGRYQLLDPAAGPLHRRRLRRPQHPQRGPAVAALVEGAGPVELRQSGTDPARRRRRLRHPARAAVVVQRQLPALQQDRRARGAAPATRHQQRDRLGPVGRGDLAAVPEPERGPAAVRRRADPR